MPEHGQGACAGLGRAMSWTSGIRSPKDARCRPVVVVDDHVGSRDGVDLGDVDGLGNGVSVLVHQVGFVVSASPRVGGGPAGYGCGPSAEGQTAPISCA